MFDTIEKLAQKTVRRAAFAGLAGGLTLVGAGFFTVALFLFLVTQMTVVQACLLMGFAFTGLGLIVAGLTRAQDQARSASERPGREEPDYASVLQAFFTGLQQGMAARQRRGEREP